MPPIKNVRIKKYLLPLTWIYSLIVFIRNKLFDFKILKQKSYDIPVICIGNITVGGTGKTPHTEYLVKLLSQKYKVAVLSRGYKRKTKGFVLADAESTVRQIGDESYQIKNKFPNVIVAVDAKRTRGIEILLALPQGERPEVILLDDAYQHRYVKPSYSILLTDYNRLISQDALLPAGRLREPAHYAEFANTIIVTKCPKDLNPLDQRITLKEINPYPYQDLLYTTFNYSDLVNVYNSDNILQLQKKQKIGILTVTGIANPKSLHRYLRRHCTEIDYMDYPDHHQFSKKDIIDIQNRFEKVNNSEKIIVVTEKDAARLRFVKKMPEDLKPFIYYIPIEVTFINKEEQVLFDKKIIDHVKEDRRNIDLYKITHK